MKYCSGRHRSFKRAFTLVEIMIVLAIFSIIIAIAVPTWVKQRALSRQRSCQENLRKINGAKEEWAMENKQPTTAVPVWENLVAADGSGYLKRQPFCPGGGDYAINAVNVDATCTITDPPNHNDQ